MQKQKQHPAKMPAAIIIAISTVCLSVLGGYGGAKLQNVHATSKENQAFIDDTHSNLQTGVKETLETYYSDIDRPMSSGTLINDNTLTELSMQAADLVTEKLINNSVYGVATDSEIKELEGKIKEMFISYQFSESQVEDLSKAVAAVIESDLAKLNQETQGSLLNAALSNIEDLEAKVSSLQSQVDEINTQLAEIDVSNTNIRSDVDFLTNSATSSEQTGLLQSQVETLTGQYDELVSKYNDQTSKIQELINESAGNSAADSIRSQITSLQDSLTKLQTSASSEIAAIENRITELKSASPDALIQELETKIQEQEDQISGYKTKLSGLNSTISSLNVQLNELDTEDSASREDLQKQLNEANNLINQTQSDIDSANADISDMQNEINTLKNGTADSIVSLQGQASALTDSLKSMANTQNTLSEMLATLQDIVGDPSQNVANTLTGDLFSAQAALNSLENRVDRLENKVKNITSGVSVPFSFGVNNGQYGYFGSDGTFVDFKSQSDINSAVSDAIGSMTGTANATNKKYTVTAHGSAAYGTQDIKKNYDIAIAGSQNGSTFNVTANGQNVYSATVANTNSGTYTASSRGASLDMGASNSYRYVNTNSVPNSNSGTYTFPSGDKGTTKDMGATNSYRYVNAEHVYYKGVSDGRGTIGVWHQEAFAETARQMQSIDWQWPAPTGVTIIGVYVNNARCASVGGTTQVRAWIENGYIRCQWRDLDGTGKIWGWGRADVYVVYY